MKNAKITALALLVICVGELQSQEVVLHRFSGELSRTTPTEAYAAAHLVWAGGDEKYHYRIRTSNRAGSQYLIALADSSGSSAGELLVSDSEYQFIGNFPKSGWYTLTIVCDIPLTYESELSVASASPSLAVSDYADAMGDALPAGFPQHLGANYVSPDMTQGRAWLSPDKLHVHVSFDPATMDRERARLWVYLNVDGDSETGSRASGPWPPGTDIAFMTWPKGRHGEILRWTAAGAMSSQKTQALPSSCQDGCISIEIPRSLIGRDLSRLQFYILSGVSLAGLCSPAGQCFEGDANSGVLDTIPLKNGRVYWLDLRE